MNKSLKLTILIVEDEKSIATVIAYNLQKEGFSVHMIHDGEEALKWIRSSKPDLVLLDWMLPSKSGSEICNELRNDPETSNIPIIMISAKDQDFDKVTGLELGADDYITKPFSPVELIARVKAVIRRIRPAFSEKSMTFHDVLMNLNTHTVSRNGQDVRLAPIEFQILQIMMEQKDMVISRKLLIDKIWESEDVDPRTVDVHITRLRKALLNASVDDVDIIKTVRLKGYKLHMPKKRPVYDFESAGANPNF